MATLSANKFSKLYKVSSTGALWEWSIEVEGSNITERWGVVGGKIQATTNIIREGKNLGRSNATTPETQALAEASSAWQHKVDRGYVPSQDDAMAGVNELGGVPPMLAKSFSDIHPKYIRFPAFVQPKLDGMRCVSALDGQFSRSRKPLNFPHIAEEIERLRQAHPELSNAEFDGELYLHRLSDNFQKLMSICRKENHPEQHLIEYWVYDIIDPNKPFSERFSFFESLELTGCVKVVPTVVCYNQADVDNAEARFVNEGYEGAMFRVDEPYEFKRSANLLKIKQFQDEEFEVKGILEGRGKLMGHAGALLFEADGKEFSAKPAMPDSVLREIFLDPDRYIGVQATVKYQGKSADGIPRFPVVKDFRGLHE